MTVEHSKRDQVLLRKQKLARLRTEGFNYPNNKQPQHSCAELINQYQHEDKQELEQKAIMVSLAGRMMTCRAMGKASFCHLQDRSGQLQIYLRMQDLPEGAYDAFSDYDLGDILYIEGVLFKTKKGELSVYARELCLLSKSLHPLPDKFHGLADRELCYRQRYVDIMVNEDSRQRFLTRANVIQSLRSFLTDQGYIEVETPMMHAVASGANARPFITHHNTLDMQLYMRVAPELYLKRLLVGGMERVFEINRNFRNEGISTRHNPEFTMVEYYQAYADYLVMMDLTEQLLSCVVQAVEASAVVSYQGHQVDFSQPIKRQTMCDAIIEHCPEISVQMLSNIDDCRECCKQSAIAMRGDEALGELQLLLFEHKVEHKLIQPCFITQYPTVVSPLARASDENPEYTDRFELFVGGKEIANGFSELNDPVDQAQRFAQQASAQESGDTEAMGYDHDYIRALEYAMPPAGGVGIGIDRLVMLLTDASSIRDVILFPLLRNKELTK